MARPWDPSSAHMSELAQGIQHGAAQELGVGAGAGGDDPERLPLVEPNLQPNPVKLAPHRHRHALQTLMHLIFKFKFANHR